MRLLSLFCLINSPDISMHMYINFNTLLKAGSLMISFFLMDPRRSPSICSLEAMGEEGEYEACIWTRRLDIDQFWLSGGSLAWPCSSGLFNPSGCAINKFRKSWGLWTFLIAILSIHAGTKTWKRIADRLKFPMNSFPEDWAVPPMNPNFFSSSKSITETPTTSRLSAVRRPFA